MPVHTTPHKRIGGEGKGFRHQPAFAPEELELRAPVEAEVSGKEHLERSHAPTCMEELPEFLEGRPEDAYDKE